MREIVCRTKEFILILSLVKPSLPEVSSLPKPRVDNPALLVSSNLDPPAPSRPLLLWVDQEKNDPRLTNEIRQNHQGLEIEFKSTPTEADRYLQQNLRDIEGRNKVIVICRGYYESEKKNFVDLARILDKYNFRSVHLAVYTRDRAGLLERTPDVPRDVEIFNRRDDLLAFINRFLR
jgi:hypothetical protein